MAIPYIFKQLVLCSLLSTAIYAGQPEDLKELIQDHTQFAFSLYPVVDKPDNNLLFSPYGISTCLSMVYLGARGETEAQMQKALHLEIDRKSIAKTALLLNQSLLPMKNSENTYRLNIANALWIDQGTFLLTDFRYAIEEQFKAKLGKIDFSNEEDALKTINGWVSENTQGKIQKLLSPEDINPLTRLVLTNAIDFQGSWKSPFDPTATQDWPFHPTEETTTTVKMMRQTTSLPYYENKLMQVVALPVVGTSNTNSNLAFVLLLPKSAENFAAMLDELPDAFDNWLSSLSTERIELMLPKYTINTRLPLKNPLEQLGMEDAFDSDANFMGIDGMRELFLNTVIHQAFFDLNEQGVTASAATAASIGMKSILEKKPPIALIADHPFLFFIVDLKSHEMLFMGKLIQPGT